MHLDVTERRANLWLWTIIAVAVLMRVGTSLYMGDRVQNLPGIYDQISYDRLAQNVAAGNGFSFDVNWWPATRAREPTAHWSYFMTLYLAGAYKLFGHHPLVPRLIQAVISGILMPLLTYRLAARLSNRLVGLVAAVISAVYIYFFYYAAALMTEPFFFLAILGALNIAVQLAERPTWKLWVGLGLIMGCAVLLRQTFLLFVPFLLLWIIWTGRDKFRLVYVLVPVVVLVLMILPWTIRNYLVFNQFVLLNTNAGYVFFWANHPVHGTDFISLLGPEDPSYYQLIPPELLGLDEAALEKALMSEGLQFVVDDPVRYILLSISRIKDYFLFWPRPESSLLSNISRVGSFGLFLPFMLYGLVCSFKSIWLQRHRLADDIESAEIVLLYAFIVVYTGVHLLSWAGVRYRLPVDAVLVIFAAVGIYDLYTRFVHQYACRLIEGLRTRRGA